MISSNNLKPMAGWFINFDGKARKVHDYDYDTDHEDLVCAIIVCYCIVKSSAESHVMT